MLTEEIQSAVKRGKAVLGYRESVRFLKTNRPQAVVVAQNVAGSIRNEIEHNAKVSNVKFEIFDGNSRELGIACGKPFPVSVIAIED